MKKILFIIAMTVAGASFAVRPSAYSTTLTTTRAGGTVSENMEGEVVCKYFEYTTTALSNASVALVSIPANARVIDGEISVAAMGGAEVFDLGLIAVDGEGYINKPTTTADDVDLFLDGIACSNAVTDTFANLVAGDANAAYAGFDTPVYLTITAPSGEAVWVADKLVKGWVQYIKP